MNKKLIIQMMNYLLVLADFINVFFDIFPRDWLPPSKSSSLWNLIYPVQNNMNPQEPCHGSLPSLQNSQIRDPPRTAPSFVAAARTCQSPHHLCLQQRREQAISIDGDLVVVIEPQDNKFEGGGGQRRRVLLLRWWLPQHSLRVEPLEVVSLLLLQIDDVFPAERERERTSFSYAL